MQAKKERVLGPGRSEAHGPLTSHQTPDGDVVRKGERDERADADTAGGLGEESEQQRAETATLPRIGDRHGHFGDRRVGRLPDEPGDADRTPVARREGDERDVIAPVRIA